MQLLFNLSGAYFINKQYSKSLSVIEDLEKRAPNYPGLLKLKTQVLKFNNR